MRANCDELLEATGCEPTIELATACLIEEVLEEALPLLPGLLDQDADEDDASPGFHLNPEQEHVLGRIMAQPGFYFVTLSLARPEQQSRLL